MGWAPADRVAQATGALVGIAGGIGGVLATTPLVLALERLGIEGTFLALAVLTGLLMVAIRLLVRHEADSRVHYSPRLFIWLIPVFAVGIATFVLPHQGYSAETVSVFLVVSMALIGILVFAVSRDVTAFLLETGLLFEEFFDQATALLAPTLAFFTYYTFVVIVFGCIYRIVDRLIPGLHFVVSGVQRDISFLESLYFSIITLSTVGYGDLLPFSPLVRAIAALQIVIGVWLIIFGFSEVLRYARERDWRDQRRHGRH